MSFEMTPRRAAVLTALLNEGGELQDPDGQATALLMAETGHRTTNALSGVLMQLDNAGLIERDIGGRRTYRISLTRKGRAAAEKLVAGTSEPEAPELPAVALDGSVDLDLLAGVLLKKALIATQAAEQTTDVRSLKERLAATERRADEAEARAVMIEGKLDEVRTRLAESEAARKTLEHNNATLLAQLNKAVKTPGTPITELISKRERVELEKLMRSLPTARG